MSVRDDPGRAGLWRGVRALRHRNFRLLWAGQWARATGLWMQLVATPLLVLEIGGSALDLGVVYSLQFLPILFLAPFGGVLADRVVKRRAIMLLQSVSAVQALLFVVLLMTDAVALWQVYLLASVMGFVNAAEMPTRTSFVAELVPDRDLPNAVALMMVAFNGSRIIGPAIAGLIAAAFGYAANFGWAAAAAILTLVLLTFMDEERSRAALPRTGASVRESLLVGLRYVAATPRVYAALGVLGTLGVFGISFQTIAPVYALETLGLDERGYGLLVAAMGIGTLLAAIPMTLVTLGLARRILYVAPIAFGVVLGALALNTWPPLAFVLVAPLGFCFLLTNSSVNVTIQGTVPHEVRGRAMGIYMSVMHGGSAIGALVMGTLAEAFDVQVAMLVGAVATLLAVFALRLRGVAATSPAPNARVEASTIGGPEV